MSLLLYEIRKSASHNPGENVNNHFVTATVSKKLNLFLYKYSLTLELQLGRTSTSTLHYNYKVVTNHVTVIRDHSNNT